MVYYKYNSSKENIFTKIKKERKFYIVLDKFISLLIVIFITFYLSIIVNNFLTNYFIDNNNSVEVIPNVVIKPILQINDGIDSKIEATADKALFVDKDNINLENVTIKGNNDFILKAKEGNINVKNGEISLEKRPITTIINE